jgi:hypothetical protein
MKSTYWRISTLGTGEECPDCGERAVNVQWLGRALASETERRRYTRPEYERRKCVGCGFRHVEPIRDVDAVHDRASG